MHVRDATPEDYETFARFFVELAIPDPLPPRAWWEAHLPDAFFFEADEEPVGYALVYMLGDLGGVMHLVVAEQARGRGVGRALMDEARRRLAARGAHRFRLHVKVDNEPAIRLYRRCGMSVVQDVVSLELPFSALDGLPSAPRTLSALEPEDDEPLECAFDLPRGRLARDRAQPSWILLQVRDEHEVCGLASFDPRLSVVFRLCARDLETLRTLLAALPRERDSFRVNLEGRPDFVTALRALGATTALALFRMEGAL